MSTARLSFERADNGLKCEAARATVVWTELMLLVQRAEAEHAAWVDTCHALRHLDWSQQLHTTMTALRAEALETESQLLLGSLLCCKAKHIP